MNRPLQPACRPEPVNIRILRRLVREAGFDVNREGGLGDALGLREMEGETAEAAEAAASAEDREARRQPVPVENVGGSWIKFGLYISNEKNFSGDEKRKRHLPLFVTALHFNGTARVGSGRYTHTESIGPDYCGGQLLYWVFGGKAVKYQPNSQNPLHNLTLYLSNFDIYDKRGAEEPAQPAAGEGEGAAAHAAASVGASAEETSAVGNCVVYIPKYKIKMTLTGYFMTEKGNVAEDFVHQTIFYTTAINNC